MFEKGNVFVFIKMDALPVFDFDVKKAQERILRLNPEAKFFSLSAKKDEGVTELENFLLEEVKKYKGIQK